ncbi:MAG: rhomboid family intramembrane serine protease [Alphaproteobacteria bacterium]
MIPYKDINPTRTTPVVTYGLVAANILVFIYQIIDPYDGMLFACVPRDIFGMLGDRTLWPALTVVTSAFLHGDILHIGFNMLFLWVFADNIEDRLGHGRFLGFYLTGAVIATLSHVILAPSSAVPMVGASGAISAVLGAYAVLYPKARIRTLIILIILLYRIEIPAAIFLGLWFGLQILSSLASDPNSPGVAWYAHIGGFVFGFIIAIKERRKRRGPSRPSFA